MTFAEKLEAWKARGPKISKPTSTFGRLMLRRTDKDLSAFHAEQRKRAAARRAYYAETMEPRR